MTHRNRLNSVLWTGAVLMALALSLGLMLQVKSVNSRIAETDRAILSARQQIASLETEFQTRSRQQQLTLWNEVDFGYVAPKAGQFLDGRTQLAALGKPVVIEEAAPIRMAAAEVPAADSGVAHADAPVRMASASAAPKLKGDADAARPAAKVETPVRLASATPGMMRQLVARDSAIRPVSEKPERAHASAKSFADRFDLESVIEGAR